MYAESDSALRLASVALVVDSDVDDDDVDDVEDEEENRSG